MAVFKCLLIYLKNMINHWSIIICVHIHTFVLINLFCFVTDPSSTELVKPQEVGATANLADVQQSKVENDVIPRKSECSLREKADVQSIENDVKAEEPCISVPETIALELKVETEETVICDSQNYTENELQETDEQTETGMKIDRFAKESEPCDITNNIVECDSREIGETVVCDQEMDCDMQSAGESEIQNSDQCESQDTGKCNVNEICDCDSVRTNENEMHHIDCVSRNVDTSEDNVSRKGNISISKTESQSFSEHEESCESQEKVEECDSQNISEYRSSDYAETKEEKQFNFDECNSYDSQRHVSNSNIKLYDDNNSSLDKSTVGETLESNMVKTAVPENDSDMKPFIENLILESVMPDRPQLENPHVAKSETMLNQDTNMVETVAEERNADKTIHERGNTIDACEVLSQKIVTEEDVEEVTILESAANEVLTLPNCEVSHKVLQEENTSHDTCTHSVSTDPPAASDQDDKADEDDEDDDEEDDDEEDEEEETESVQAALFPTVVPSGDGSCWDVDSSTEKLLAEVPIVALEAVPMPVPVTVRVVDDGESTDEVEVIPMQEELEVRLEEATFPVATEDGLSMEWPYAVKMESSIVAVAADGELNKSSQSQFAEYSTSQAVKLELEGKITLKLITKL